MCAFWFIKFHISIESVYLILMHLIIEQLLYMDISRLERKCVVAMLILIRTKGFSLCSHAAARVQLPPSMRSCLIPPAPFPPRDPTHTAEYDPFNKSQLAPRNEIECLLWCKSGHAPLPQLGVLKPASSAEWMGPIKNRVERALGGFPSGLVSVG